ncbi:MAG: PhoH family protein [Holosporaceae bacterium]
MNEVSAASLVEFSSNEQIQNLVGPENENLDALEKLTGTSITHNGNQFSIRASTAQKMKTVRLALEKLYAYAAKSALDPFDVKRLLQESLTTNTDTPRLQPIELSRLKGKRIVPKTKGQDIYLQALEAYPLVFVLGAAGTGKTFLSIAFGLEQLAKGRVKRIILVRPAIEAGEKLGFLPGSLQEKINPYLQPFYDALYSLLPLDVINKKIDTQEIEAAPLAYMRGRTLSDAFIIVDEAQNITHTQMKMLLTRIGEGSRMVITGDPSQIDIARKESSLVSATNTLKEINDVVTIFLDESNCVRHPLVKKIMDAYREQEQAISKETPLQHSNT